MDARKPWAPSSTTSQWSRTQGRYCSLSDGQHTFGSALLREEAVEAVERAHVQDGLARERVGDRLQPIAWPRARPGVWIPWLEFSAKVWNQMGTLSSTVHAASGSAPMASWSATSRPLGQLLSGVAA